MMARAAMELFGLSAYGSGLLGGSLKVPSSSVLHTSDGSTLAPVAELSPERTPIMSKLTWSHSARLASSPLAIEATCSTFGVFSANLYEPEMSEDAIASDFRGFLSRYAHDLREIEPGSDLERVIGQIPSLAKARTAPEHSVRFTVFSEAGNRKFTRTWDLPDSVDVMRLARLSGAMNERPEELKVVVSPSAPTVEIDTSKEPAPSEPPVPSEPETKTE